MTSFVLWAVSYVGARLFLESSLQGGLRLVVALVPLPFFLWTLVELVGAIRELDELERRIQLEALAIAFPLAVVLFMTLGLIEVAQPLDPDNWSFRHVWPFLTLFYIVGLLVAKRRYEG